MIQTLQELNEYLDQLSSLDRANLKALVNLKSLPELKELLSKAVDSKNEGAVDLLTVAIFAKTPQQA